MKVAVVGGGLFGTTAAIHAARAGHEVHLFEKGPRLMGAASAVNQFRLHRGYHYPRSPETGAECREAEASFDSYYGPALIDGRTTYAVAAHGSKIGAAEYLGFLTREGLAFRAASGEFPYSVSAAVQVPERRIDPERLRDFLSDSPFNGLVRIQVNTPAAIWMRHDFDAVIIAAYASTNEVAIALDCPTEKFQYEVIEKPVLQLPKEYRDLSIVIMDGEFCSLDPYGTTGLHLMGHVKHAIHNSNVGIEPEVPGYLMEYLNRGIVLNPIGSKIKEFIEDGKRFIPALRKAEHIGSMFTVRAVLPDVDATDERPTLVHRLDGKVIRIFSGKLGTCVVAAQRACEMIKATRREAA